MLTEWPFLDSAIFIHRIPLDTFNTRCPTTIIDVVYTNYPDVVAVSIPNGVEPFFKQFFMGVQGMFWYELALIYFKVRTKKKGQFSYIRYFEIFIIFLNFTNFEERLVTCSMKYSDLFQFEQIP